MASGAAAATHHIKNRRSSRDHTGDRRNSLTGNNPRVMSDPGKDQSYQQELPTVTEDNNNTAGASQKLKLPFGRQFSLQPSYPGGKDPHYDKGGKDILPHQKAIRDWYQSPIIQIFVAALIFANFFTSACNSEMLPDEGTSEYDVFLVLEYFFTFAFLIELLVNMYGAFFFTFYKDGWNWFDFIIVTISLLSLFLPDLPAISVLRLFRAFRVVRLFKRVKEMRKIVDGVMKSLPPMLYAVLALVLIMGIWAIMGVEFFKDFPENDPTQESGYFFGHFFRAMLSLMQIMTFDSWSSGIARDIIYEYPMAALYFVTYVFVAGIVLANVLISILLDTYMGMDDEYKAEEEAEGGMLDLGDGALKPIFKDSLNSMLEHLSRKDVNLQKFNDYLGGGGKALSGDGQDNKNAFVSGVILANVLVTMLLDNYVPDDGNATGLGGGNSTDKLLTYLERTGVRMDQFVDFLHNGGGLDRLKEFNRKQGNTGGDVEMARRGD